MQMGAPAPIHRCAQDGISRQARGFRIQGRSHRARSAPAPGAGQWIRACWPLVLYEACSVSAHVAFGLHVREVNPIAALLARGRSALLRSEALLGTPPRLVESWCSHSSRFPLPCYCVAASPFATVDPSRRDQLADGPGGASPPSQRRQHLTMPVRGGLGFRRGGSGPAAWLCVEASVRCTCLRTQTPELLGHRLVGRRSRLPCKGVVPEDAATQQQV